MFRDVVGWVCVDRGCDVTGYITIHNFVCFPRPFSKDAVSAEGYRTRLGQRASAS